MKSKVNGQLNNISSTHFPVVGIGASAGGLDAFKRLISAIPVDSGMAFILAQHVYASYEKILVDLLQRATKIPVLIIGGEFRLEANHIYIIPANKLLTDVDGVFQLSPRDSKNHKLLPIDSFLCSLAALHEKNAIGIVLSGAISDGTSGLKAIKERGGITFAQSLKSAAYRKMPQNAIAAGVVDFVLSPEEIPGQLLQHKKNFSVSCEKKEIEGEQKTEEQFKQVMSILRIKQGVDFTYYKQPVIRRKILKRTELSLKPNIAEYLKSLKNDIIEQDTLYQDLLISSTHFFRDPKVFERLVEKIFPALLTSRPDKEPLRIWIAGCSTGEEAYSIAICFQEYVSENSLNTTLQIFATDISDVSIAKARSGLYLKREITDVSPDRLQKFFTKSDDKFQINKQIRDSCVFAYHNYLNDTPFAKIDIISCRNSMSQQEPFFQRKALAAFHYSLNKKGFLILGNSESAAQASDLYNALDKTNCFYTPENVNGNFLREIDYRKNEAIKSRWNRIKPKEKVKDDFQRRGDELVLSTYAPPGVIINDAMDIVEFRGSTNAWLESSPGAPSLNVLKMVREGLAFQLRAALQKVKNTKERIVTESISMQFDGKERSTTIEVMPLTDTNDQYFLILFKDTVAQEGRTVGNEKEEISPAKPAVRISKEKIRNELLKKELRQMREDVQSITKEQDAANEELQRANEELLSGSEELQSLNEELLTSKEEIQTSNEELITVNQALNNKNEQLNISRLFAESIVKTIREPLLILDRNLKIKIANRSFCEKFQVTEKESAGTLIFELKNKIWDMPALRNGLDNMLQVHSSIADLEVIYHLPLHGERIVQLNASQIITDHLEEGSILMSFEDITEKRKAEQEAKLFEIALENRVLDRTFELQEAQNSLQLSIEALQQFAYLTSHDLQEPLQRIMSFSTILEDQHKKNLPEEAQGLVSNINKSSEHMSSLFKALGSYSKILHTKSEFEPIDLDEILDQVIGHFALPIADKKVVIRRKPLLHIDAVPYQIKELFCQLISNAIKFSRVEKTIIITITSKILSVEEEAKYENINPKYSFCEICIKDNGIGFKKEFTDQIFLAFHRSHDHSEFSGTGIGLAVCKTIAANHHGQISAVSNEKEGALFKILLPLKQ